ncbi:MAG: AmmeMemoRadiSam system protein B [Gammaproteobacteria bacterium]|nr:AmmeMemoRadiSam system protein B [Gammaproteobacteria bacterium]
MLSTDIRQPAVAGLFYPQDPVELEAMLSALLGEVKSRPTPSPTPRAIIAPHAGYIYSGPIAATAYAQVSALRGKISRIVLLGPAHRAHVAGVAASRATHFASPLGLIPLDQTAIQDLLTLPYVNYMDAAHTNEHSLEVHLPFLQKIFAVFTLVPLLVGAATAQEVAAVLERFWEDEQSLIVISSDLSHYHEYCSAQQRDHATSAAIEALALEQIAYEDACGRDPIKGLLQLARNHQRQITTLDLRNSGDTAGPRDRVVGYGAYAVY